MAQFLIDLHREIGGGWTHSELLIGKILLYCLKCIFKPCNVSRKTEDKTCI